MDTATTTRYLRYHICRTAYHGGGLVSRHYTRAAAERAARRLRSGAECLCGCVGVVDTLLDGAPPEYTDECSWPYQPCQ